MKTLTAGKITCFLALLVLATPSHAYLDPGTGSMILQGVIAAVAAASFTLKMYWYRIRGFFSREKAVVQAEDQEQKADDQRDS